MKRPREMMQNYGCSYSLCNIKFIRFTQMAHCYSPGAGLLIVTVHARPHQHSSGWTKQLLGPNIAKTGRYCEVPSSPLHHQTPHSSQLGFYVCMYALYYTQKLYLWPYFHFRQRLSHLSLWGSTWFMAEHLWVGTRTKILTFEYQFHFLLASTNMDNEVSGLPRTCSQF